MVYSIQAEKGDMWKEDLLERCYTCFL